MKNCDNCNYWDCGMFTEPCNSCYKLPDDGMSNWKAQTASPITDTAATDKDMLCDLFRTALRDLHATPNCATCAISDESICERCTNNHYDAYKWRYEDEAKALLG